MISLLISVLLKAKDWEALSHKLQYLRNKNYHLHPNDYLEIIQTGSKCKELAEFCIKEVYGIMQREKIVLNSTISDGLLKCCLVCRDFITFTEIYSIMKSEDCSFLVTEALEMTGNLPELKAFLTSLR